MKETCDKWYGKRHQWGKWTTLESFDLVRERSNSNVGKFYIQKRICERCNLTQYNKQKITL